MRDQSWRRWYWTARWKRLAKQQLDAEPLCRFCAQAGRMTAATVCDHVVPHKGNVELFWGGERQSLCKPCHDGVKQAMERGRGRSVIGLDGYPIENGNESQR
jgi:5-methylcytosine-specific restriction enzyme A